MRNSKLDLDLKRIGQALHVYIVLVSGPSMSYDTLEYPPFDAGFHLRTESNLCLLQWKFSSRNA